jgi:SAM-dependent methyltransferase
MLRNALTPELLDLIDAGCPGELDFYQQYARTSGGPVLVLFCGTGRIALPIARQGIPVIGLDSDVAMIDQAKRKAQQAGAGRAMFVQGDPAHFVSESKHPLVIIPSGTFQKLLTLEEQKACLMAVRHALALGGKLLIDLPIINPGYIEAEQPLLKRTGEQTAVLKRTRSYDGASQVLEDLIACDWLDNQGNVVNRQYATSYQRFCTPGEVTLLLESCGFSHTLFGGFDHQALVRGATRLFIEAERRR